MGRIMRKPAAARAPSPTDGIFRSAALTEPLIRFFKALPSTAKKAARLLKMWVHRGLLRRDLIPHDTDPLSYVTEMLAVCIVCCMLPSGRHFCS